MTDYARLGGFASVSVRFTGCADSLHGSERGGNGHVGK